MFFKNAVIFNLTNPVDLLSLEDYLESNAFKPCNPSDSVSTGWTVPAGYLSKTSYVYRIGQYDLIALKTGTKILPAASVNKLLKEKIDTIESEQKRKMKAKEKGELKAVVIAELLPKALSQEHVMHAYVDNVKNQIIVDSSSVGKAEDLVSILRKAIGTLPAVPIKTLHDPSELMSQWISIRFPEDIEQGNNASISTQDDGVISLKNINLLSDEVRKHIDNGGNVTNIAIVWDKRASLTLTSNLQIKKLKLLDVSSVKDNQTAQDNMAAQVESDLIIFAATLTELMEKVLSEFGGMDLA